MRIFKKKSVKLNSEARPILERLIQTLGSPKTLYYEGKKTPPGSLAGQANGRENIKSPVTEQRYYLTNDQGILRIRVESSALVFGMRVTTVFVKDEDGIWEVQADEAWEVSKIFTSDQLLGVFPFLRLFSCLQHPYELHLSKENRGVIECFVIDGKLPDATATDGRDIAKKFSYLIGQENGLLCSLHEVTIANRTLNLEFDKLELNQALDPALFKLSDKPKTILSSLDQYFELRNQEMMKRLKSD